MNISEVKSEAKSKIKGKIWEIWKPFVVIMVISFLVTTLVDTFFTVEIACPNTEIFRTVYFDGQVCTKTTLFGNIINLLYSLVSIVLSVGTTRYLLNFVRGKKIDVKKDLLYYFQKNFKTILLTGVLASIFISLWSLLFIVPGIIAALTYSMINPILVDGSKDVMETLRKSKEMMKGYKWNYFCFQLSFIGWHLLGIITIGIAYIYIIPYLSTSQVLYYEKLKSIK